MGGVGYVSNIALHVSSSFTAHFLLKFGLTGFLQLFLKRLHD